MKTLSCKSFIIILIGLILLLNVMAIAGCAYKNLDLQEYRSRVKITALNVDFPSFSTWWDYEIHWTVENLGNLTELIQIEEKWILPNGNSHNNLEFQLLSPHEGISVFHTCIYETNLYGRYVFNLKIRDPHGNIIDYDCVYWYRNIQMFDYIN